MSSIKMQPTDHTSIAAVYSEEFSKSSRALYHRVTTYSVMNSFSEVGRARPKSQIFRSQFAFNKRLLGFRSLWMTFAECMYFSPLRIWYKKYCKKINHNISVRTVLYVFIWQMEFCQKTEIWLFNQSQNKHQKFFFLGFVQLSRISYCKVIPTKNALH